MSLSYILSAISDIVPKLLLILTLILYYTKKISHKLARILLIIITIALVLNALSRLGVIPSWEDILQLLPFWN